jgi:hypothetical protein
MTGAFMYSHAIKLFSFIFIWILLILRVNAAISGGLIGEDFKKRPVIVLVGVKPLDLTATEQQELYNKDILELNPEDNWYQAIKDPDVQAVILRQRSGFVGLYNPSGVLVRPVNLASQPNIALKGSPLPYPSQNVVYSSWDQLGYNTGGRMDPYRPQTVYYSNRQQLAPGWGYNSKANKPSGGPLATALNLFSYAPLSLVTPFNYPGNFQAANIATVYSVGVLPHVGGLLMEMRRSSGDKARYDANTAQPPFYAEYPVQYYNPADPSNPMSRDPNMLMLNPMPQAFQQNFPNYVNQSIQYQQNPYLIPR